ncbi:MAG: helix-turn-helix domain-containing protein [Gallionella sp.]|nr:helix-turn-helix domain-containing protein [Gallionella sp.]MDD4959339.1 helix-turn-helix domain-containing protein [Gallionella sp.]
MKKITQHPSVSPAQPYQLPDQTMARHLHPQHTPPTQFYRGYKIDTVRMNRPTECGKMHYVAEYVLHAIIVNLVVASPLFLCDHFHLFFSLHFLAFFHVVLVGV